MIIPPASAAACRYFARTVVVPQSRRERLRHLVGRQPDPPRVSSNDPLAIVLFDSLNDKPLDGHRLEDIRSVSILDEDQDGRRRMIAFLFDRDAELPFAVGKAQTDTRNGSLQREAEALEEVDDLVPPEVRRTVPKVLRCERRGEGEALFLTALPGRSAWHEMNSALYPPGHVAAHFEAAAEWLARFHQATQFDERLTAQHGDYWPHNLLLDRTGLVGVIDWENFASRGPRFADLFVYPLTYGLAYPWRFYRRVEPQTAFVNTFLKGNRVSRAVRSYLQRYIARTGVPRQSLMTEFREFLSTRGTMDPVAPVLPGLRDLPWGDFAAELDRSSESAFS